MDYHTIQRPKDQGRLGLISVVAHTHAMAGILILWTIGDGDHPMQCIYMVKIGELSLQRRGVSNYSWVVAKCRTLAIDESKIWLNMTHLWNKLKGNVQPSQPTNSEEKMDLPIWVLVWVSNFIYKDPKRWNVSYNRGYNTNGH